MVMNGMTDVTNRFSSYIVDTTSLNQASSSKDEWRTINWLAKRVPSVLPKLLIVLHRLMLLLQITLVAKDNTYIIYCILASGACVSIEPSTLLTSVLVLEGILQTTKGKM